MDHPQDSTPQNAGFPRGSNQRHDSVPSLPPNGHRPANTWGTGQRLARRPAHPARSAVTTLFAMLAAMALMGLSCTDDGRPPLLSGLGEQSIGLRTDLSCDDLVAATRKQFAVELAFAESQMADGGFATTDDMAGEDFMVKESDSSGSDTGVASEAQPIAPDDPAAARGSVPQSAAPSQDAANADDAGGTAGGGEVVAGTNNQESGVDEADIVKTDGKRIVSLVDGVLRVVGLDGSPAVDGALDLSSFGAEGAEMFLRGDEALVLLPAWGSVADLGDHMMFPEDDVMTMEDGAAVREQPTPREVSPPAPNDDEATTAPGSTVPETTTAPPSTTPLPSTTTSTTSSTTSSTTTTTTLPEVPEPEPLPFDQGVRILRVDLVADGAPAVVEQRAVEGQLVAARMINGTARLVVRSMMPVSTELQRSGDIAEARTTIDEMTSSDVMPRAESLDGDGVESLGGCGDVAVLPVVEVDTSDPLTNDFVATSLAVEPSTVSVLTVGDDLGDLAPTTVAGLADVVYASTESMFVTSAGWDGSGPQTLVHQFDLADEGPATYTGSGAVPGTPLNQYSLSEHNGDLRIVTTTEGEQVIEEPVPFDEDQKQIPVSPEAPIAPSEPGPDQRVEESIEPAPTMFTTEGRLTVLRPGSSGTLDEVGAVEDLGIGESVQSVRFLGDMAYVVTFRQTDPLYAIDLSDPTDPKALGELKITGFSQYLHPVGDGLLLGVGREATEDGFDTGFKASLFDVSDPTNPVEVDKIVVPDASSLVADDPLAFTWDPVARQAIIPLERYDVGITRGSVPETMPAPTDPCVAQGDCGIVDPGVIDPVSPVAPMQTGGPRQVALVLKVDGDQLTERGELVHDSDRVDPWRSQILRSVVVDRDLWTLSQAGLGRSNADDPTSVELLPF